MHIVLVLKWVLAGMTVGPVLINQNKVLMKFDDN